MIMGFGSSWQWRILFLMIFCWNLCSTTTDYDLADSEELLPTTTSEPLPYFDDHGKLTNITAPLGSTAFLHCKVNLLKDKTCKSLLTMYQRIAALGKVDRLRFREVLHTTFDITDDVMLDRVYRVFDTSNDGVIDETEWVEGVAILCRGNPDQLIDFCYTTYDINGDGSLAREELYHCLKNSLFPYSGVLSNDELEEGIREIVEITMRKLDVDKDGQITQADFTSACYRDPLLLQSIGPCLPPAKSLAAFMATFTENYRSYSSEWSEDWKVHFPGGGKSKRNLSIVSWMKRDGSKVRLLTFGLITYSGDERLSINFEQPNNWKLRIQTTERRDQGEYQCQVSSHPPIILHVSLSILVPKISIVDDLGKPITDKFYNAGSTLELRCIISNFHFPDGYSILWKQGNKTLNYDASRGGISVKTTVNKKEGATSVLYIANAKRNDSGPYICSLGTPTTQLTQNMIYVHVINGDVPAAMQHSAATSIVRQSSSIFAHVIPLVFVNLFLPVIFASSSAAPYSLLLNQASTKRSFLNIF